MWFRHFVFLPRIHMSEITKLLIFLNPSHLSLFKTKQNVWIIKFLIKKLAAVDCCLRNNFWPVDASQYMLLRLWLMLEQNSIQLLRLQGGTYWFYSSSLIIIAWSKDCNLINTYMFFVFPTLHAQKTNNLHF